MSQYNFKIFKAIIKLKYPGGKSQPLQLTHITNPITKTRRLYEKTTKLKTFICPYLISVLETNEYQIWIDYNI